VQPLDAGIIRCFKARYRHAFCIRALDLDDAGESDIYKIDLLEAMMMAKEAWDDVDSTTIKNCWDHTQIQRTAIILRIPVAPKPTAAKDNGSNDKLTWKVVEQFAGSETMTLPETEEALRGVLGDRYVEEEWSPILKVVMDAEKDTESALATIKKLRLTKDSTEAPQPPMPPPSQQLEQDLMGCVTELRRRNRIHGEVLTIEELIHPKEELEVDETDVFEGDDAAIVAQVHREHEVVEVESDSEDKETTPMLSSTEIIGLCQRLEACCLDVDGDFLELARGLRRLRAKVRKEEMQRAKQVTLDMLWTTSSVTGVTNVT
jgi:hypothetical protein